MYKKNSIYLDFNYEGNIKEVKLPTTKATFYRKLRNLDVTLNDIDLKNIMTVDYRKFTDYDLLENVTFDITKETNINALNYFAKIYKDLEKEKNLIAKLLIQVEKPKNLKTLISTLENVNSYQLLSNDLVSEYFDHNLPEIKYNDIKPFVNHWAYGKYLKTIDDEEYLNELKHLPYNELAEIFLEDIDYDISLLKDHIQNPTYLNYPKLNKHLQTTLKGTTFDKYYLLKRNNKKKFDLYKKYKLI